MSRSGPNHSRRFVRYPSRSGYGQGSSDARYRTHLDVGVVSLGQRRKVGPRRLVRGRVIVRPGHVLDHDGHVRVGVGHVGEQPELLGLREDEDGPVLGGEFVVQRVEGVVRDPLGVAVHLARRRPVLEAGVEADAEHPFVARHAPDVASLVGLVVEVLGHADPQRRSGCASMARNVYSLARSPRP